MGRNNEKVINLKIEDLEYQVEQLETIYQTTERFLQPVLHRVIQEKSAELKHLRKMRGRLA